MCRNKSGQLLSDSWKNTVTPDLNSFVCQKSREDSFPIHVSVWVESQLVLWKMITQMNITQHGEIEEADTKMTKVLKNMT